MDELKPNEIRIGELPKDLFLKSWGIGLYKAEVLSFHYLKKNLKGKKYLIDVAKLDANGEPILLGLFPEKYDKEILCFGKDQQGMIYCDLKKNWQKTKKTLLKSGGVIEDLTKEELEEAKKRIVNRLKIFAWGDLDKTAAEYGLLKKYGGLAIGYPSSYKYDFFPYLGAKDARGFYVTPDNFPFSNTPHSNNEEEIFYTAQNIVMALSQPSCDLVFFGGGSNMLDVDLFPIPENNPFKTSLRDLLVCPLQI